MSIRGLLNFTKSFFGGAWTAPDPVSIDQRGAILAQNVRYFDKQVETRYGWGVAISYNPSTSGGCIGLFNWLSEVGNYLIWGNANGGGISLYITKVNANPPIQTLVATLSQPFYPAFAQVGPRLYVGYWQAVGGVPSIPQLVIGVNHAGVITWSGTNINYDSIIPGPPSTTLVPSTPPTEPSAGVITAGNHNIGLRMLHRSGFLGRPGPDSSTTLNPTPQTFAPIVFTSTGNKNLNWSFTPGTTWPADVIQVQLLMSPVNNPYRYFLIPGAVQSVTGGVATPVNITVNITDEALVSGAAAIEATDSLNLYTASATGLAYANFGVMRSIGSRMFYVSELPDALGNKFRVVFASDSLNFQNISIGQHVIQLPNQLDIVTVFGVQGAIYLVGPHWTYVTQDTGGVPVTWPQPQIVDGRKGALYPNCVEVASTGRYAWIGDRSGLYYFDGSYPPLPISHLQKDLWDKLVMPDDGLSIKDDPVNHRVVVHTFLGDGSIYIWDYTNGDPRDPYSVRFSQQTRPGAPSTNSMELVQNDLYNNVLFGGPRSYELWFGPAFLLSGTFYFHREKNPALDNNVYRDEGASNTAIHSVYDTHVLPDTGGGSMILAHQGLFPRITGAGTMSLWKVYSIDRQISKTLPSLALSTVPDQTAIQRCYLKSPRWIYRFEMNAIDAHFILSNIVSYYSVYAGHR